MKDKIIAEVEVEAEVELIYLILRKIQIGSPDLVIKLLVVRLGSKRK